MAFRDHESYCDNLIMSNADAYLNSKSNFEILTMQEPPAILRLNRYVESDKSCRVQRILSAIPCIDLSFFLLIIHPLGLVMVGLCRSSWVPFIIGIPIGLTLMLGG